MRTTTEALTVDFAVGVRFAFTYQLHVCSFKFSSGDNVKSQDTLKARNTIVNYVISHATSTHDLYDITQNPITHSRRITQLLR